MNIFLRWLHLRINREERRENISNIHPNKVSIGSYLPCNAAIIKWANQLCTSSSCTAAHTLSLDCIVGSHQMTCPPYRLTFSTLQVEAFLGITKYSRMSRSFAAKANAAA